MNRKKVGKTLRECRGERSVPEVARALGVTPNAVTNWECGIRIPRDELKEKIAKYYRRKPGDIFFED